MTENSHVPPPLPTSAPVPHRSTWGKKLLVAGCVLFGIGGLTAASAAWWYNHNFNAGKFEPVHLSLAEQQVVDEKLAVLNDSVPAKPTDPAKTIVINEREINSFLKEQVGEHVQIKISKGNLGATAIVPMEQGVPVVGGKNVRVNVTFNTQLDSQHKLMLSLADVNVGGISLPNAWLGNLKGLNMLDEAVSNPGTPLASFAAGIKSVQMSDGEMRIVLND